jgi:hypothetical protein
VLPVNLTVPKRGGRGVHPGARFLHKVTRAYVLERLLYARQAFQTPLHHVGGPLVDFCVHKRVRADGLLDGLFSFFVGEWEINLEIGGLGTEVGVLGRDTEGGQVGTNTRVCQRGCRCRALHVCGATRVPVLAR